MARIIPINPGAGNDVYTNLSGAYASANDGDIIDITGWVGTYIMTGNITTTKRVALLGGGIGVTIIKRSESSTDAQLESWESMIRYNIGNENPCNDKNGRVIVTGITFKSRIPSATDGTDGLSVGRDMGIRIDFCIGFKIYNCRFENFGNGAINVIHRDYFARGLIYSCQFYHNAKGASGLGLGYGIVIYGEGIKWIQNVNFGGPDFIFIENCTFNYHRHSIASAGGAMWVARYNFCDFNIISGPYIHCFDGHDARGPGNFNNTTGCRAVEAYNNTLTNSTCVDGTTAVANGQAVASHTEHCIGIFAGDSVIYNNVISGYRFGIGIDSDHISGSYPYFNQPGWISARRKGLTSTGTDDINGNGDMWYWNNTITIYNYAGGINGVAFYNYQPSYFAVDREWHASAKPNYVGYKYPHPDTLVLVS